MTIDVTGRHVTLTPALRSHAEEKIRKLGRLVDNLEIHVTLSSEKHRQTCTIVAHGRKARFTSEVTGEDFYAAINECVDIVARQLRKNKTSRLADKREGAESIRNLGASTGAVPTTAGAGTDET